MAATAIHRFLAHVAMLALMIGCTTRVYEVEEGYTGWAIVKHGVSGCQPLPVEQGQPIHRVPRSGILCTSDFKEKGWLRDDRYFEVGNHRTEIPLSGPTTSRRIWSPGDGESSGTGGSYQFEAFFVGTWAQQEADPEGIIRLTRTQP
jgi:hypothetical protein